MKNLIICALASTALACGSQRTKPARESQDLESADASACCAKPAMVSDTQTQNQDGAAKEPAGSATSEDGAISCLSENCGTEDQAIVCVVTGDRKNECVRTEAGTYESRDPNFNSQSCWLGPQESIVPYELCAGTASSLINCQPESDLNAVIANNRTQRSLALAQLGYTEVAQGSIRYFSNLGTVSLERVVSGEVPSTTDIMA